MEKMNEWEPEENEDIIAFEKSMKDKGDPVGKDFIDLMRPNILTGKRGVRMFDGLGSKDEIIEAILQAMKTNER